MRILMFGGSGLVGANLAGLLARQASLGQAAITELVLADARPPKKEIDAPFPVRFQECDLRDGSQVRAAFADAPDLVFHLAAVMSGVAERDYDLAWQINVEGTRRILEASRALARPPRLVYTSSTAVYGENSPDPVPDDYPPRPTTAYGTQKLIGELMVLEYSRKGFVDGRIGRLAGVAVRPDDTHQGAAAFITSLVREPLLGRDVVCPVPFETRIAVITPRTAAQSVLRLAELPEDVVRNGRTIQFPALSMTVADLVEGVRRAGGDDVPKRVRLEIDQALVKTRQGIATSLSGERGRKLGFPFHDSVDGVIAEYLQDAGLGPGLNGAR